MKKVNFCAICILFLMIFLEPLLAEEKSEPSLMFFNRDNEAENIQSWDNYFQRLARSSSREKRIRKTAMMLSFNLGPLFGGEEVGLNIDEGIEFQFSKGGRFLWGLELDYHVTSGGFGFAGKTGPIFNLIDKGPIGNGPNGLLLQFYPGYKVEIITGLNSLGTFPVHMFNLDINILYQHVTTKGFLIGGGLQSVILLIPAVDELKSDFGSAFGFGPVFHIGFAI